MRREVEGGLLRAVMRADARQQWTPPGAGGKKKEEEVGLRGGKK